MKAEKEKLVIDNIGLAYKMARVLTYYSIPMEDRISIASLGLVEAALIYDESKGNFEALASAVIRNKMIRELQRVCTHKDVCSLDKPLEILDGEEISLIDVLPDAEAGYEKVELSDLTSMVDQLPLEQRRVIRFVFVQRLGIRRVSRLMRRRASWLESQMNAGIESLKLLYLGGGVSKYA